MAAFFAHDPVPAWRVLMKTRLTQLFREFRARSRKLRLYYPKSFLKLIFIGFILVALPLVVGLVNSVLSIDRLADQSRRAVYQAAQAAHGGRVLVDEVTAMERSLRQAVILNDASLLEGYERSHTKFVDTARSLATLPLEAEQLQLLQSLMQSENAIHQQVAKAPTPEEAGAVADNFVALSDAARRISAMGNALIEREVDAMKNMASNALRIMQWQLLALIPVAIFLVFGFALLLTRPIRQIDEAIRRMGQGDLSGTVVVEGPQDLRYLGERLDWMRQRLLELEEQKNRFLRHLSHELKTPLTALREGAELFADGVVGPLSGEQQQVAEILRHNSLQLQRLIEDLLSYATLQAGPSALTLAPVQLRAVVDKVLSDQKLAILNKRILAKVTGPDTTIQADAEKLRIIMDNLLSNAIKFSPPGGAIDFVLRRDDDHVTLDVIDQGPGIAPDEREKVFAAFYQGPNAAAGYVKGTGLGLSIAREYVLAHHGSIAILESTSGAHFRITLPIETEAA